MYPLDPPAVYAHESVMANPTYRARVERVVAALEKTRDIVTYRDDDLPDLILHQGLMDGRKRMGRLDAVRDPILLFNTFRFDSPEAVAARRERLVAQGVPCEQCRDSLVGTGAFHWARYNLDGDPCRHDKVCRPCWRIHLEDGCVHRCKYCDFGGLLVSMVNIEEYCEYLGHIIERHPWQKTYLLDDDGDPPGLEPELGVASRLIEYFGTLEDRYLVVHTKTWNTRWLRSLKHNGNTIMLWSISGATQSRFLEPKAGSTEERVEAARIAQEAGCPVRFKFKPIIPVRNWREEAAEAVRLVFERTTPDVISLCVFMWMTVDDMKSMLPVKLLDPEFLAEAESSVEEVKETRTKPFPPRVRAAIYDHYLNEIRKYDADIPVSLSTETFAMWKAFQDKLGMSATNYVCGCGPQSVPGARKLDAHAFNVAVRNDAGAIPGVVDGI
ncbi:MAG TPA: radical SAM protein [Candidatus Hydrogenedentes bacterium]|nr:radical SAM protein [Candidatus Hydrogenedentota bacterium]HPG66078.1 radical SAM protein [Candidatus Hydrogenedentota bacterium]